MLQSLVNRALIGGAWLLLGATLPLAAADVPDPLARQRAQFLEAEAALDRGDRARFRQLAARLQTYPLHPYLQYEDLRSRLPRASAQEVGAFLDRYDSTPLADPLRTNWLATLAQSGRWQKFLADYRDTGSATLRCYEARALWETGRLAEAAEHTRALWLHGRSQPQACDEPFRRWKAAGHLTGHLVWERIHLAMQSGETGLARYLGKLLSSEDRSWLDLWQRVQRDPTRVATTPRLLENRMVARWILADGLNRLISRDTEAAADAWLTLADRMPLAPEDRERLQQRLALFLLLDRPDPAQHGRVDRVLDGAVYPTVDEWRIRRALLHEDWHTVLERIGRLPEALQAEAKWRYWKGRALAATGQTAAAQAVWATLAEQRDYYGFLAADRLDRPYRFEAQPPDTARRHVTEVAGLPGIRRARELHRLGRAAAARREWALATQDLSEAELLAASQLAHSWDWHDRAIFTVARTGHFDALSLRFPTPHRTLAHRHSHERALDPAWVFALMRQESAFMPDARSSAGAIGLMQLLPTTARQVARREGIPFGHALGLVEPETNIRLGTAYLANMYLDFHGHAVLATAAYNAGPHRVREWLPRLREVPADVWIENMPYWETRGYVKRILEYTAVYEAQMGRTPTRLRDRMPPVPAAPAILASN